MTPNTATVSSICQNFEAMLASKGFRTVRPGEVYHNTLDEEMRRANICTAYDSCIIALSTMPEADELDLVSELTDRAMANHPSAYASIHGGAMDIQLTGFKGYGIAVIFEDRAQRKPYDAERARDI